MDCIDLMWVMGGAIKTSRSGLTSAIFSVVRHIAQRRRLTMSLETTSTSRNWIFRIAGFRITSYNVCYTKLLREGSETAVGDRTVDDPP